mgnify:CR=1 FL=1
MILVHQGICYYNCNFKIAIVIMAICLGTIPDIVLKIKTQKSVETEHVGEKRIEK